ncbi:embryonic protein UVS.2-like [Paramacrobiotus metropolitanus]|uniref:embryonic protein UVS.2-like n=1 Tax=Paramacrobiotus metropolitanus TaxID=2943436 RepID=UPI002445622B|nr:embryonic protein UVS.2-like [Paramacrobiotus metropolitanus]
MVRFTFVYFLKSFTDIVTYATLLYTLFQNNYVVVCTTLTAFKRSANLGVPIRSAIGRDTRFVPWENSTAILYRLDPAYSAGELALIQQAMTQISSDMKGCIRFQPYSVEINNGMDFLYISRTLNSGSTMPTCFSFPGRVVSQDGAGQKVALFNSPNGNGCMDSVRDVMKFLAHALGLRNEYNRPDRDKYITVFTNNIKSEMRSLNLFMKYTPDQVDYLNTEFDYNSITMPSPTKYANPGSVIFASSRSGQGFGNLPRLSQSDCIGIGLQYTQCNFATCSDPYLRTSGSRNSIAAASRAGGSSVIFGLAMKSEGNDS